jgi:hypothetical protein
MGCKTEDNAMGKSAHGPDTLDWEAMMRTIELYHGVYVWAEIRPSRGKPAEELSVIVKSVSQSTDLAGGPIQIEVKAVYPTHKHKTLDGLMYHLLHQLDFQCGKELWSQAEFKPE